MLRLALAQLRPRKGAYEENLCRLGAQFRELASWREPPELVIAPETALTGYFVEGGVRAVVQPGGSVRDEAVIEAARAAGLTMYFTGTRHFFH